MRVGLTLRKCQVDKVMRPEKSSRGMQLFGAPVRKVNVMSQA